LGGKVEDNIWLDVVEHVVAGPDVDYVQPS
jgi:hypothetical protein